MPPWNATKAKRLRTLQEKKEAQAKATRRDIATLLERGKLETARIKVENIINEDIYLELLELLELYSELLIARFGLLEQNTPEPDPGVSEAVCSIIYAAPRTELKELHVLRDLLMHKYGREFSLGVMENRDNCVSDRVLRKINVGMPPPELVDAYLTEIAKGYGLKYSPRNDGGEGGVRESESDEVVEGEGEGVKTPPKLPELPLEEKDSKPAPAAEKQKPPEDDFEMLKKRFEALKKR
ncbi:DUF292-domain-containing protein [Gloeophyllum trabeum ATCC 11539]|uniref:DUF292-domain-containing protein n=1 Tax=Gloeophyllum trabeum (strain ATCC 11539 / FP-39264 / Madison 617) TaxID=670483 RepID=S7S2U8_GLOTA|nr:DUF292-domain-containing protein [Gloeophyllum trabeum ATCC 11539]EPQ60114.1 DUF292-domain-containing protein [Gloeophyllum trabeum ATCC 11539]